MAVKTNTNYYSNAIVGTPSVGDAIDVHKVDLTPKYQVGFGFERSDGAKFRYCQVGVSDTNRGVVVAAADSESGVSSLQPDIDAKVWKPADTTLPNGVVGPVPCNIGSHYVWATLASVQKNQYAGGYLITTDDDGEGYTYRIKGNKVTDGVATGVVELELYDPLVVALGTNTDICIVGCRYANVVAASIGLALTANKCAIGVICAGASANNYAWVQTAGVCGVLQAGVLPVQGESVTLSTNVGGAVQAATVNSASGLFYSFQQPIVGYCIDPGDSTGHSVIQLWLE